MLKKIKHYFRFWGNKPPWHVKSSPYGGFHMDINKYYSHQQHREELKAINQSFGEIIKQQEDIKEKDPVPTS